MLMELILGTFILVAPIPYLLLNSPDSTDFYISTTADPVTATEASTMLSTVSVDEKIERETTAARTTATMTEPPSTLRKQQKFMRMNAWILLVAYYVFLMQLLAAIGFLQNRNVQVCILNVPVEPKRTYKTQVVFEKAEADE
ncbi:hypothetical protein L596_018033 [Steinernema carpocapsae]|uniref:Uncharacterized protein n=1 Tax=Steinernema carpocapsae TaxID=34508 RepID=A0A4U5N3G4_STECR|nr:hypothetical protein L596_018033 [Steinernema carpocapsae]